MTSRKRYVLLEADAVITTDDWNELARRLDELFGPLKTFAVSGNDRAFIVKTDVATSKSIRANCSLVKTHKVRLECVRTSGSIGKLKRLATGSAPTDGEIPQR